jgi:hypothetical protein
MRLPFLLLAACTHTGDSTDVEPPGGTLPELFMGAPVVCAAPTETPSWTDVAAQRGLEGATQTGLEHGPGGSAAVEDFDGDGDYDIALSYIGELTFYLRDADAYARISAQDRVSYSYLSLADLNGDGQPEVLAGGKPTVSYTIVDGAPVRALIVQEGTYEYGFPSGQSIIPADIDGDGVEDAFAMLSEETPDYVLRGVGDGLLAPWDGGFPAPEDGLTGRAFDARWFDWDVDGDLDLYVVNDMGPQFGPNALYKNEDGTMVDVSSTCACDLTVSGMGVDSADYDNDGDPDLYVSEAAGQALLNALGDGTFVDVTLAAGLPALSSADMGWGAIFLDADNDGLLDIFLPKGDQWEDQSHPARVFDSASELLLQAEDGSFHDAAPTFGMDAPGSWRSSVAWDDNGDGVLDLLVTDVVERPMLLLSDGCTVAGWLEVTGPVGARVEVDTGDVTQTAWITRQSGMGGSRPPRAHFGLGESDTVDDVRVVLTDGTMYEAPGPLEARRVLSVPDER